MTVRPMQDGCRCRSGCQARARRQGAGNREWDRAQNDHRQHAAPPPEQPGQQLAKSVHETPRNVLKLACVRPAHLPVRRDRADRAEIPAVGWIGPELRPRTAADMIWEETPAGPYRHR